MSLGPDGRQDRSGGALAAFTPLLQEIGDLKRVRSAGRHGSVATRLFGQAWAALAGGAAVESVMVTTTARALAAARLGDLDREGLLTLGLAPEDATMVLRGAFDDVAGSIAPEAASRLRDQLGHPTSAGEGRPPRFARALEEQPRAGVTCPGRPRIVLQPTESHAEHCLAVAVYGVILAPIYEADPAVVFLAGLAHHMHNAAMPDSGFTGEALLGPHLAPVMERATHEALDELAPALRERVVAARRILADAETSEGRAFHAADVLDRVLEIDQHLRVARLTMAEVLDDMALVHDGPVKPFHDRVLAEAGLA